MDQIGIIAHNVRIQEEKYIMEASVDVIHEKILLKVTSSIRIWIIVFFHVLADHLLANIMVMFQLNNVFCNVLEILLQLMV